jgi:hypothetical protein
VLPHDRKLLPLQACRDLTAEVFAHRLGADALPPRVEDGRGRRHAAGSRTVIKLPRWARTRPIVLHECAHGLATDGHGPDFVRAYVELLVEFMGLERAVLEDSLRADGVRVTPLGQPIAAPATPKPAPVGIARTLATRLLAIGIRTLADLRSLGPVEAWVRLKRKFGRAVGDDSLMALAALGAGRPAASLDGRTRAQLKFEATGRLIAAKQADE